MLALRRSSEKFTLNQGELIVAEVLHYVCEDIGDVRSWISDYVSEVTIESYKEDTVIVFDGDFRHEEVDVLIEDPHGGGHERFLEEYPEVIDEFVEEGYSREDARSLLDEYFNLERDLGAREMAEMFAEEISRLRLGIRVSLVRAIDVPRGILDLNRLKVLKHEYDFEVVMQRFLSALEGEDFEYIENEFFPNLDNIFLRPLVDFTKNPRLFVDLAKFYDLYVNVFEKELSALTDSGTFIATHTMRDFTVRNMHKIVPCFEGLKKHIDGYKAFNSDGDLKSDVVERGFELIGSFRQDHEELGLEAGKTYVGDRELADFVHENLEEFGITVSRDLVYWMVPWVRCAQLLARKEMVGRGLVVDAPVGDLSKQVEFRGRVTGKVPGNNSNAKLDLQFVL